MTNPNDFFKFLEFIYFYHIKLITNPTFSPMQPFSLIKAYQLDFTAASSQTLALWGLVIDPGTWSSADVNTIACIARQIRKCKQYY